MLNSGDMFGSVVSISIATVAVVFLVNVSSCAQEHVKQETNMISACVSAGGSWLTRPTSNYGPTGCIMESVK